MAFNKRQQTDTDAATGTINVLGPQAQQNQPQPEPQQSQQVSSGESAQIQAGQPTTPQTQEKAPAASGSFTNIRKFLQANRGAGAQMADTMAGKIEGASLAEKEKLTGTGGIAEKIEEAKNVSSNILAKTEAGGLKAVQTAGGQAVTPPKAFGQYKAGEQAYDPWKQRQADLTNAQALTAQQYRAALKGETETGQALGQMATQDWTERTQAAEQLKQQAEAAQTAKGRFDLLRQMFANKDAQTPYTTGAQRLDTMLLQQAQPAVKDLATRVKTAVEGESGVAKTLEATKAKEAEALRQIGEQQKLVKDVLAGEATGAQTAINKQVSDAAQAAVDARNKMLFGDSATNQKGLVERMADGDFSDLTAEEKAAIGFTEYSAPTTAFSRINSIEAYNKAVEELAKQQAARGAGAAYGGVPAQEWAKEDIDLIDKGRFASTAQAQREAALAELFGGTAQLTGAKGQGLDPLQSFRQEQYASNIKDKINTELGDLRSMLEKKPGSRQAMPTDAMQQSFDKVWEKEKGGYTPSRETLSSYFSGTGLDQNTANTIANTLARKINPTGSGMVNLTASEFKQIKKVAPSLVVPHEVTDENTGQKSIRYYMNPNEVWNATRDRIVQQEAGKRFWNLRKYFSDIRNK